MGADDLLRLGGGPGCWLLTSVTAQTAGVPDAIHPGSEAAGGPFPEAHQQVLEVVPLAQR